MKKTFKVVILPTEKATKDSSIFKYPDNQLLNSPMGNQHLYIISDDEIKEGDWYLVNQYGNGLLLATKPATIEDIKYQHKFECKKIIATTDKSLTTKETVYPEELIHPLPQPSESFIQKYIENYNKGEVIKEVMVECDSKFETIQFGQAGFPEDDVSSWNDKPKVNPKDNTINIQLIKTSWTKEEVESLFNQFTEFISHHEPSEYKAWLAKKLT